MLHLVHHRESAQRRRTTSTWQLRDGPFRRLQGRWEFHALDESACKVSLRLDFEPQNRLLAPALQLGIQGLADRMVDDFVREADKRDG